MEPTDAMEGRPGAAETMTYDFREEAEVLVRRTSAAYFNRGEAVIDHHLRWMHGERRGCGSTSDKLVGMAEGLRDVVGSWGIPGARMSPGEFEAESFFFGVRRWDFAVTRGDGLPVALIELKQDGARHGHGGLRRDVETIIAMCTDFALAYGPSAPIFRGVAFVMPAFRRSGALLNERLRLQRERDRRRRLETAADRLVFTNLVDAVLALKVDGGSLVPFSDALAPERFLARLHAFLISLPAETWIAAPPEAATGPLQGMAPASTLRGSAARR